MPVTISIEVRIVRNNSCHQLVSLRAPLYYYGSTFWLACLLWDPVSVSDFTHRPMMELRQIQLDAKPSPVS